MSKSLVLIQNNTYHENVNTNNNNESKDAPR